MTTVRLGPVASPRGRLEARDGHLLERRRQQLLDVPQQVAVLWNIRLPRVLLALLANLDARGPRKPLRP
jgi:ABC-type Fe3+-siderophore transport system permease subunit